MMSSHTASVTASRSAWSMKWVVPTLLTSTSSPLPEAKRGRKRRAPPGSGEGEEGSLAPLSASRRGWGRGSSPPSALFFPRRQPGAQVVAVHAGDELDADLLGAGGLALEVV